MVMQRSRFRVDQGSAFSSYGGEGAYCLLRGVCSLFLEGSVVIVD